MVTDSDLSTSAKIRITFGLRDKVDADMLVIACDPTELGGPDKRLPMKFSAKEEKVFSNFDNFTFHTSVVKVEVPADDSQKPKFGIVLKPEAIDEMAGTVSGFRNESAKTYSLETANQMQTNLVTVYQIRHPHQSAWTSEQFLNELRRTLPGLEWWPYGSEFEVGEDLLSKYFMHFNGSGLGEGLPWTYLDLQGENNTFYVHASTCFESVLQCYQYIEKLFDLHETQLPRELDAPIAILGAGVSGLLAAHFLKTARGYTNVTLYEKSDRYGGKSMSVTYAHPKPEPKAPDTVCELGTCYLSPAYDDMYTELESYFADNPRLGFRVSPPPDVDTAETASFRGMVTAKQFGNMTSLPTAHGSMPIPPVMGYQEFTVFKGLYESGLLVPDKVKNGIEQTFMEYAAPALEKLLDLNEKLMGGQLPMPRSQPHDVTTGPDSGSFYDFLKRNDLLILTGLLEYSYSVQGYGPLHKIPAYYGLIWISPPLIRAIIRSYGSESPKPMVTYLQKGWHHVWEEMSKDFNIEYNKIATHILRKA